MQTLKTATGIEHEVSFCGVSRLSGLLIFSTKRTKPIVEYAIEFSNPENTQTLTYQEREQEEQEAAAGTEQSAPAVIQYAGYTEMISIAHNIEVDEVQIMLNQKRDG